MSLDSIAGIFYHLGKCWLLSNTTLRTILSFSKTAHQRIVRAKVQLLQLEVLNFLSPELWPPTATTETH